MIINWRKQLAPTHACLHHLSKGVRINAVSVCICVRMCSCGTSQKPLSPLFNQVWTHCPASLSTRERLFLEQWIYTQCIHCYLTPSSRIFWSKLHFSFRTFSVFYALNIFRQADLEPAARSWIYKSHYTLITWWTEHWWSLHLWDLPVVMFLWVLYQWASLSMGLQSSTQNPSHTECEIKQRVQIHLCYFSSVPLFLCCEAAKDVPQSFTELVPLS